MTYALAALLIALCAWLNRVRGGGDGGQYLKGAPDLYVAPPMALIAAVCGVHSWAVDLLPVWPIAAATLNTVLFALCWLAWSTPAWGTLYRLGFIRPVDRPGEWYERLFVKWARGNLFIAFGLRMTLCLIPMAVLFGWPWLLLGPAMVGTYWAGWKLNPLDGIPNAERFTGALFGVAFALGAFL